MNWEKLFEPHILQRGYAYYRDGAVTEISAAEDAIEATVEGSEDYSVEVSLKNGEVAEMECTCPYAENGAYCKHMAAVLYAYENGSKEKRSQTNASQPMAYEQLQADVNKADSQLVRKFLADIL